MPLDGWTADAPVGRMKVGERWRVFVVRHNYRMWWWREMARSMVVDFVGDR